MVRIISYLEEITIFKEDWCNLKSKACLTAFLKTESKEGKKRYLSLICP